MSKDLFKNFRRQIAVQESETKHVLQRNFDKISKLVNIKVQVVIPALNEERNIAEVLCRLRELGYDDLLVIDGNSKDHTAEVAAANGAKVVLQKGKGKGNAIKQILKECSPDLDALVLMDADGSMSAEEIPLFMEALVAGADVAKGSRFIKGGSTYDMSLLRKFGNKLMTNTVNFLWSSDYTDLCYGYFVLGKQAIQKLAPVLKSDHFEIETEIFIKALKEGLVVKEVPSTEYARKNGQSNLHSFRDGFKILKTIAKESLNSSNQ